MPPSLRIAYLAHSLRSDWNNGNAHFLRGLMRALTTMGHNVRIFEPCSAWSIQNLQEEKDGLRSLHQFEATYSDLSISPYNGAQPNNLPFWRIVLKDRDVVILHEWNPPELAATLLQLRNELGFRLLFHDTHHRAYSSPGQMRPLRLDRFDGVLAFGDALRQLYQDEFELRRVWTLHEAADTTVFRPHPRSAKLADVVWIGNWGDNERSKEIREFLLRPAAELRCRSFSIFGVRYPDDGLTALNDAGVRYGGYLPNLDAPCVYSGANLTVHVPRRQYTTAMRGIPTIRVFEALACGIPLVSAPWDDSEHLFREGDFVFVRNTSEMIDAMEKLLGDASAARAQALRGLETILSRHTCAHRAERLTSICEEILH